MRKVRVQWREGFDDRELVYNDRPMERMLVDTPDEVRRKLLGEGWELESSVVEDGDWTELYGQAGGGEEEGGRWALEFVTNPGVMGVPGKEYRAAVAVRGEWAACSAPQGSAVAEVFRRVEGEWRFDGRLRAESATDSSWLPDLAFVGDELLVAAPMQRSILRFGRRKGEWKQVAAQRSELGNYGAAMAADGERVVANGCVGRRYVAVLRDWAEGPMAVETRIAQKDEGAQTLAMGGEWLAIGTGTKSGPGEVYVYRASAGVWRFAQMLPRPKGCPEGANFGAAVGIAGERMLVTNRLGWGVGAAAHWYVWREGQWGLEGSLELPELAGEQFLAWDGETAAIGFPYCYGDAGRVVVVRGRGVEQVLRTPESLFGERFGEAVSVDGDRVMAGAQGTMAGGGCGYLFCRKG